MKISSVSIKNLRSFKNVTILFNPYTCFVGPNGAGKSTVLCALNIFFRETEHAGVNLLQLCDEDFHQKITTDPIEITVTFTDLSEEAQKDFADYYRQDQLVISALATYNPTSGKADIKQFGKRMVMPAFKEFFKANGDKALVDELKSIYKNIRAVFPELEAATTKEKMIAALHNYEAAHPQNCELVDSEDHFYGASKGADKLAKYVQWIYVPAVKDVTTEQVETKNTALGRLVARTVRSKVDFSTQIKELIDGTQVVYDKILESRQNILTEISGSLQKRLTEWAHPEAKLRLEWQESGKSIRIDEPWAGLIAGEGGFEGSLGRFGHGLQRSYLLALLHELAGNDVADAPTLILGCEEPELYQHPPQARHLASVLKKLSTGNSQIIISTHNPLFISGDAFEDVRMVRKNIADKHSLVTNVTYQEIASAIALIKGELSKKPSASLAKIHQVLQPALNEMFFTTRLILVEGIEDVAYLTSYLTLSEKWEEFRRLGCHIVSVNGKSELLQPTIIAQRMQIPTFVIFDADSDETDETKRKLHERDNRHLLKLFSSSDDPLPKTTVWGDSFTMWTATLEKTVSSEIGLTDWQKYQQKADALYGHAGSLRKNILHIGATLAFAWEEGKRSASLDQLCSRILDFSKESTLKEAAA